MNEIDSMINFIIIYYAAFYDLCIPSKVSKEPPINFLIDFEVNWLRYFRLRIALSYNSH